MARVPSIVVVRGGKGESLEGVRIVVERAAEPVPEMAYVTGADGAARIGLPPGRATLRLFLADGASRSVEVEVADAPGRTYDVRMT